MSKIVKHTKKILSELVEEIHQYSEGRCPFCFAEDFPVKGQKTGYDEVSAEDAEEWQLEHCDDCLVLNLDSALSKITCEHDKGIAGVSNG